MAMVLLEEQVEIPFLAHLADFRHWAVSDEFPEEGRIDYIAGRIEVDKSPEDFFTHGTLKTQVAGRIEDRVYELDIGHTCCSDTRISSVSRQQACTTARISGPTARFSSIPACWSRAPKAWAF